MDNLANVRMTTTIATKIFESSIKIPPRPTAEPTYHKAFYTPIPQVIPTNKSQFEVKSYVPHPYHPTPHPFITGAGRWGTGTYATPHPVMFASWHRCNSLIHGFLISYVDSHCRLLRLP